MDFMSGVAAAKQAYDLLKVIKDSHDQAIISGAIGELHGKITELQMLNAELSGLYQSEREVTVNLREEKRKIEMFVVKAENYELHTSEGGSTVYRSKVAPDDVVKPHYLCAHCYGKSEISILQPNVSKGAYAGYFIHYCPLCKNEYKMSKVPPMDPVLPRPIGGVW